MAPPSDQPPRGEIPLTGWIVSFMLVCVVVSLALLVLCHRHRVGRRWVLAVVSLLSCAGLFRKFQRRPGI
jgi:apolipoprotein N-acyltransferase